MRGLPPSDPGPYLGPGLAALLRANEQQYLLQGTTVVAGGASIAVQLERIKGSFYPFGVSFEFSFLTTPGAFQYDVQTADTDTDISYVTLKSINLAALNSSFVGRIELPSLWAKFTRVKLVSMANAVNSTVLVTH